MSSSPTLLGHSRVTAQGATPARWMLFVHGVMGSGGNFRTFARRFVEAHPSWGAVLVDLRLHGASLDVAGPHTVTAAAEDLVRLEAALAGPVDGVLGHSLGGKVALEYVRLRAGDLSTAWVLDSAPGLRPRGSDTIERVLRVLREIGPVVPTRENFMARVEDDGLGQGLAQWLAMNLRADGENYRFRLDLDAIRDLLDDYWLKDLWSVVEAPPGRVRLHMVVGGRSATYGERDRARLVAAAAAAPERLRAYVLDKADHWVHVDDPEGLFRLVSDETSPP